MANYEDNRIRCSKATAEALITSDLDAYFKPIDFRKALGMLPYTNLLLRGQILSNYYDIISSYKYSLNFSNKRVFVNALFLRIFFQLQHVFIEVRQE